MRRFEALLDCPRPRSGRGPVPRCGLPARRPRRGTGWSGRSSTPPAASSRILRHMVRRLRGSSPVVGSSRKIKRGVPTRVIARSSRAPHAPGKRCTPACVRRRPARTGPSSSATRARPLPRPRWCRSAIRRRFSSPVSRSSTAENWPVTPIAARTPSRVGDHVVARDADLAGVGRDQRGQDLHHRRLACAVGPEQGEDRALGDGEIDAVEHHFPAE